MEWCNAMAASLSYVFYFIVLIVTRDPPTLVRSPNNQPQIEDFLKRPAIRSHAL